MTPASSATTPSDSTPQMIELLRKAGVTGLEDTGHIETASVKKIENSIPEPSQPPTPKNTGVTPKNSPQPAYVAANPLQEPPTRKSVAFVESEEKDPQRLLNPSELKNRPCSPIPRQGPDPVRIAGITRDEEQTKSPIVPMDESPEDAALRREMLQYAFSEVGAVVAELELEENSQHSSDEDKDDETEETSSAEEEEDKFGRATGRVVDEKYRKEMEALERKLGIMENIGPRPSILASGDVTLEPRLLSAVDNELSCGSLDEPKNPTKKAVRFAEELDISPSPQTTPTDGVHETNKLRPPLQDFVFERECTADAPIGPEPTKTRKVSKFKSSRVPSALTAKQLSTPSTSQRPTNYGECLANGSLKEEVTERRTPGMNPSLPLAPATAKKGNSQFSSPIVLPEETGIAPEGPPGRILLDNIIERSVSRNTEPPDPDGLDPALLRQEVAMEYHHMRNRMIQREGGFMPREEELERVPLTEEEGGSGRKVSRFKAARLGKRVGS
jgi:unconventional prefoldin RPB5 interactor 1